MKKTIPEPGDFVEIHLTKEIYEGTILESPESEKEIVLLKLGNGYNIGFNKKDILEIKTLKKSKQNQREESEIKKDPKKPNIAMIITGGTIAARLNPKKGGVDWLDTPESLFRFYPDIFEKVNVSKVEIPFMKASEDMDSKDWKEIAKTTEKLLKDQNIKGVIITHGTDFLHYTASALSFFIQNPSKPIVLTYSQRSIDRASSDANLNLVCSAILAGQSEISETMLVGHANSNDDFCYAMPATKVKKMHTSRRDAFKVINDTPIAKVFPDGKIEILKKYKKRSKENKTKSDTKFEDKVALIKIYPGQDPRILDFYEKEKYKGLILEVSGLAHVPTSRSRNNWVKKINELTKKGITICATAQTINGRLDPYVYSNGREILKAGVIYLKDMLSETALTKLGWVLGHKEWSASKEKIKEKMLENISGEFNERLGFEE